MVIYLFAQFFFFFFIFFLRKSNFFNIIIQIFFRYFEGGVSSVYLWDLDRGFAGVILIKKGEIGIY